MSGCQIYLQIHDEIHGEVDLLAVEEEVEPAGQDLELGLRHLPRPLEVLHEAVLGGVERPLHHLD